VSSNYARLYQQHLHQNMNQNMCSPSFKSVTSFNTNTMPPTHRSVNTMNTMNTFNTMKTFVVNGSVITEDEDEYIEDQQVPSQLYGQSNSSDIASNCSSNTNYNSSASNLHGRLLSKTTTKLEDVDASTMPTSVNSASINNDVIDDLGSTDSADILSMLHPNDTQNNNNTVNKKPRSNISAIPRFDGHKFNITEIPLSETSTDVKIPQLPNMEQTGYDDMNRNNRNKMRKISNTNSSNPFESTAGSSSVSSSSSCSGSSSISTSSDSSLSSCSSSSNGDSNDDEDDDDEEDEDEEEVIDDKTINLIKDIISKKQDEMKEIKKNKENKNKEKKEKEDNDNKKKEDLLKEQQKDSIGLGLLMFSHEESLNNRTYNNEESMVHSFRTQSFRTKTHSLHHSF